MESWPVKMVETPYSDWKGLEELAFSVNTDFSVLLSLSKAPPSPKNLKHCLDDLVANECAT